MKVTSESYFLPQVTALSMTKVLTSGTTEPMIVRGICSTTNEKGDYVVKCKGYGRMDIGASCREIIASFIGLELGLNMAEPCLVEITPDFIESLRGSDKYDRISNAEGLNFGCKYYPHYHVMNPAQSLNNKIYGLAQQIYAFDLFMSNSDRRTDKHNMLMKGEEILLFDHELAFGFLFDIFPTDEPWLIKSENYSEAGWIRNHYFYSILKQNGFNFAEFVSRFDVLNKKFWQKVDELIPADWSSNSDQNEKIQQNITLMVQNKELFLKELNKTLS